MSSTTPCGLTAKQEAYRRNASAVARELIGPRAADFDECQEIPRSLLRDLAREGYLGLNVSQDYGGTGADHVCIGLLHEAIGSACSSVRSVLTVHGMVCEAIQRWGSANQRAAWLPRLATGDAIGAFALSEPDVGSDAKAIATTAVKSEATYALTGEKRWVTGGQLADVFLVFAKSDDKDTAFLLDRDTRGLDIAPIRGMLGLRGAMLASLSLAGCQADVGRRIGGLGFGIDAVAGTALDFGRFTVAWGCVGIGRACVEASIRHTDSRRQFGKRLRDHQLVSSLLTEMITGLRSAELVCLNAARLRDAGDPRALLETCIAKYTASRAAAAAARDAVQLHGAIGCSAGHAMQRHYRDAKIMEIIEGSSQVQQLLIARLAQDNAGYDGSSES